ncbi:hypothetical protein, partial [Bacillus sp. S1-R2T1-FB]|uniref:hypothetical protein n=1 Tax=Bacillus sp. S1-R2T1-FB TaxID=1973493 RepID=UPI0015C4EF78
LRMRLYSLSVLVDYSSSSPLSSLSFYPLRIFTIRRPPRFTQMRSSEESCVYKSMYFHTAKDSLKDVKDYIAKLNEGVAK